MIRTSKTEGLVRTATCEEFDAIAALCRRAFIQDPVFNYFGGHNELLPRDVESKEHQNLEQFFRFLVTACYQVGGRITVTVKNIEVENSGEFQQIITAAACWLPPRKRLALWKVVTLVRSGLAKVLGRWGLTALIRIGFEFQDVTNDAMHANYKTKGVKESPDASWYLLLIMTDPAFEGQGLMSSLVREAFANTSPSAKFTLDATTAASRDRYLRLGYEFMRTTKLGEGKVNALGLPASGRDAAGVLLYSMVKWNITPDAHQK